MIVNRKIGVIIATSMNRIDSLFSLSFLSVLNQTKLPDCIVIVDDNNDPSVSQQIEKRIQSQQADCRIYYLKNQRTKNKSGTGSWNTGIYFLNDLLGEESYIAILDDDDSWDETYIKTLYNHISDDPDAVFAYIQRSDADFVSAFTGQDLTVEQFLIKDPGVQGSNMCFKIKRLIEIGCFDESLCATTDRDLMIRFLARFGNENITVIPQKLINYYASANTVTSNYYTKRAGLNTFYRKHIRLFSWPVLTQSLKRAEKLFRFPDAEQIRSMFRQNTSVLITGVCGFIGSHVARAFTQLGYDVTGIDNMSTGVLDNIADFADAGNFHFVRLSLNDEPELENLFARLKPQYVFHFAALPRIKFSFDHPMESYEANVVATKILATIAAKNRVRLFVFSSSSSVYGQQDGILMNEDLLPNPLSPYAEQKLEAEHLLQTIFSGTSSNLLILRFFNVYGYSHQPVNEYSTLIGKCIACCANNQPLTINGSGEQKRDFTYIDDVVDATIKCVEGFVPKNPQEIINIGSGKNHSVNKVIDITQAIYGNRIRIEFNTLHFVEPDYTIADNSKAWMLLNWQPTTSIESGISQFVTQHMSNQVIAIGVAMHNNASTIRRCLSSILTQEHVKRQLKVILANDNSSDNWQSVIADLLQDSRVMVLSLHNSNVVKTRNDINRYIKENIPDCVLIGRLDADDEYSSSQELAKIEAVFDSHHPDIISAGNYLREGGVIIERTNVAHKRFADPRYVLSRLKQMSECIPEGELPSCNLFVRPCKLLPYPQIESGEDHALFVKYLLNQDTYKIFFADNLLPVIYDLGGSVTAKNKKSETYMQRRKDLFLSALLRRMGVTNPIYLGQGRDGVVYHDAQYVYKIHIGRANKENILRNISHFRNIKNCNTLYRIEEYLEVDDYIVEKYQYEPSEQCDNYTEQEAIEFLVECFQNKIAVKDCKPQNFIRVGEHIKLVDMEASEYTDNLFLNMCIRMYLYCNYYDKLPQSDFQKLRRSAINNFDLPELSGAREFVNKVFAAVIFSESLAAVSRYQSSALPNGDTYTVAELSNLEQLFFAKLKEHKLLTDVSASDLFLSDNLYFEPKQIAVAFTPSQPLTDKVSLLIKTCAQDEQTIEANVKHIVRQLSSPNPFYEVILSIDTKQSDFLREYHAKGTLENMIAIAQRLQAQQVIDRYIVFDESQTLDINRRWFAVESRFAHTANQTPVAPQLYAFEQCHGDYILQMDSDVIIGRKDLMHSYLTDMLNQLKQNEKVLSVGFNIYNRESKEYFGFDDGGFVPEVRLGLIDKHRLFAQRPFPNALDETGRLTLSWHRSVEQDQHQSGYCSIRGGDNRTFYIHPQNYRKKLPYAWMTMIDRVEQLHIPDCQYGGFDCEGSFYDWCLPKRNEKMVVVSCFRNVSIPRFLRFWCSLISQSYNDFGVILYDAHSDNGLPIFIQHLIKPYQDKVTFVSAKHQEARMANVYRAIHYYCSNPDSVIVMLDGDDALIGKDALRDLAQLYETGHHDVVLGRVHQTYRLQPYYRYPADFHAPRTRNGGNVYQHLKSFRKYLFDSVPLAYFKHSVTDKVQLGSKPWLERCDDYAMMVPVVEMCENPIQMDGINYFYERDYAQRDNDRELKQQCIAEIINKEPLTPSCVFKDRQTFRPDFEHIEIDITYRCNLRCAGCNRSCGQSPTSEQMEISDIEQFVAESIRLGKKWKQINVLGGEPTLHKDFLSILQLLQDYADNHSSQTIIKVVSNGYTERSRKLCDEARNRFRNVVIDYDSYKTTNTVDYFSPFNDAPIDDEHFANADFSKACWVAGYCGIGLNARGYYGCAVCGAIDRVLNGNNGVSSFKLLTEDQLREHYRQFCSLCGNFKHYAPNAGNFIPRSEKEPFRNILTKSWKKIYTK